jgi:hypothetical protein
MSLETRVEYAESKQENLELLRWSYTCS